MFLTKPKFKNNAKININSTFPVRTKCKFCCGEPKHYYFVQNIQSPLSPRSQSDFFSWFVKNCKRLCHDFYLLDDPSQFRSMRNFKFNARIKSFKAKIHKNKGVHPYSDYVEYLTCDCGISTWAFYQTSISNRHEIKNRKGKPGYSFTYRKFSI